MLISGGCLPCGLIGLAGREERAILGRAIVTLMLFAPGQGHAGWWQRWNEAKDAGQVCKDGEQHVDFFWLQYRRYRRTGGKSLHLLLMRIRLP